MPSNGNPAAAAKTLQSCLTLCEAGTSGFLCVSDSDRRVPAELAGTLGVPLGGTRRVGGLLGVAGRLSGAVSPFRAEQGTSLVATGEAIPLRGLEGVPGLPGAPQDAGFSG